MASLVWAEILFDFYVDLSFSGVEQFALANVYYFLYDLFISLLFPLYLVRSSRRAGWAGLATTPERRSRYYRCVRGCKCRKTINLLTLDSKAGVLV